MKNTTTTTTTTTTTAATAHLPFTREPPDRRTARRRAVGGRLRRRFPAFQNPSADAKVGRRSGPATPLLRWKFDDADAGVDDRVKQQQQQRRQRQSGRCRKQQQQKRNVEEEARVGVRTTAAAATAITARRLAAGIWQLQKPEVSGPGTARVHGTRLGFQPALGHLQSTHLCNLKSTDHHQVSQDDLPSPASVSSSKSGVFYQRDPSVAFPNPAMERATKWDPGFSKASDELYRFYGQLNFLEDQQTNAISVVSALRLDLERACVRINELEDERRSSKKKLDHFLRKLAEEKASWRIREHEKVRAIINGMKDDLNRERKNRQRLEIMNSKLVNELKESKLSAKRHLQDFEKERKARELMEEVCDELAKEIGEEKAEVEAMKRDSMKIREEVEEERRMLQMAEVWREERVQMKLIDAKLTLEEKYMQIQKLQADIEAFIMTQAGTNPNAAAEIQEAEMLRAAVDLVKTQEITDFSYQPPHASEDIFSVFEELQPAEETYEREIEPCYGYSPASRASKIHTVSPEANGFAGNLMEKRCLNGSIDIEGDVEDDSGWETMSQGEEQGFSNSLDGSDPSVNGAFLESNASMSGTDWDETTENGKLDNEIIEVCSATTKQSRKKTSSISRLWKTSCPRNGENYKIAVVEATNGRLSTGRLSNGTVSPDVGCGNVNLSSPSVGQWSSPDSVNPHIARGMKGCIEWPRGTQKQSLKAKLLEARMESQKIQLRQVLKQKS